VTVTLTRVRTILSAIRLDHAWVSAAVTVVLLIGWARPVPPFDFWWHLALGRDIAQHGALPSIDEHSFTQLGSAYFDQPWLAQLAMFGLHAAGGVELVVLVHGLTIAAAASVVLWLAWRRTRRLRLSALVVLLVTVPLTAPSWVPRPQAFASLLFVLMIAALAIFRERLDAPDPVDPSAPRTKRSASWSWNGLWILPVCTALWVNVHGSFPLGIVLVIVTLIGWSVRAVLARGTAPALSPLSRLSPLAPLALAAAACCAAVCANPRGPGVIAYVAHYLSSPAASMLVSEWGPSTVRTPASAVLFAFVVVWIVLLATSRHRPALAEVAAQLLFFGLALTAIRNILWFGLLITPATAELVAGVVRHRGRPGGSPALNLVVLLFMTSVAVAWSPWLRPRLMLPPQAGALIDPDTPVAAVRALKSDPARPRRVFHGEGPGSYMMWAAPEQPVFIDPRFELYPARQWLDAIELSAGRDVEAYVRAYRIDGMLLVRSEEGALWRVLERDPRWAVHYADDRSAYFVRRSLDR